MAIAALGYMGIRSRKADDWADYAGRYLGMQLVDSAGGKLYSGWMTGASVWL